MLLGGAARLGAGPWLSSRLAEAVHVWAGKGLFSLPDHGTEHLASPAPPSVPDSLLVSGQSVERVSRERLLDS